MTPALPSSDWARQERKIGPWLWGRNRALGVRSQWHSSQGFRTLLHSSIHSPRGGVGSFNGKTVAKEDYVPVHVTPAAVDELPKLLIRATVQDLGEGKFRRASSSSSSSLKNVELE